MSGQVRFCSHCGRPFPAHSPAASSFASLECAACGHQHHYSPELLVLIQIFARDHLLLLKRGIEPYRGKWAPPGGFVEGGESLEAAAIREVREEVQIALDHRQLIPHAVVSVPRINQVYHVFTVLLDDLAPATATAPESLEVGWFSKDSLSTLAMWDPSTDLHTKLLFDGLLTGHFAFYQQNEAFCRLITRHGRIRYLDLPRLNGRCPSGEGA